MKILIFTFIVFLCFSCNNNKEPYPFTFHSVKNYIGTAVEDLAKYVDENDTVAILEFLHRYSLVSIDTRDKYFGSSLLMFAIFNGKYEAFHCLLNHGADPNFVSDYRNQAPLYFAVTYCGPQYERDPRFCKELLERGANPNYGNVIYEAVGRELEYVKLLVEYGADYNTKYFDRSPADDAIILCKPEIAEYLILEKKALLYKRPFWKNWDRNGDTIFASTKKRILDYLKEHPEQLMFQVGQGL